jgi:hypothetical protein
LAFALHCIRLHFEKSTEGEVVVVVVVLLVWLVWFGAYYYYYHLFLSFWGVWRKGGWGLQKEKGLIVRGWGLLC